MRPGSLVGRGAGVGTMGTTALLFGAVLLGVAGCGSSTAASARAVATATGGADAGAACSAATDNPPTGMPVLTPDQLPPEAVATAIFRRRPAGPGAGRLIAAGGPYPYAHDNTIFGNFGGTLPHGPRGYYREFTVQTPGARTRGTLRVVTGSGGEDYSTADHYDSFDWIACGRR